MTLGKVLTRFQSTKGNDVVIRYTKWEDLDDMLAYANALSKEDTFVELSGEKLTRNVEIKYLGDLIQDMEKGEAVCLVAIVNGKYAGSSEIHRGVRRKKHVGMIGISLSAAFREEGIGSKLLEAIIGEGKKMDLRLLAMNCFDVNTRALHVYEKLGFRKAGLLPAAYAYKGKYHGEYTLYLPLKDSEKNV